MCANSFINVPKMYDTFSYKSTQSFMHLAFDLCPARAAQWLITSSSTSKNFVVFQFTPPRKRAPALHLSILITYNHISCKKMANRNHITDFVHQLKSHRLRFVHTADDKTLSAIEPV